jgi:hypothetical protein
MIKASQMFKFTQLRPVNGIEINKIRKKHIPLYKEGHTTKLLANLQKLGLPKGLIHLFEHIQTKEFNERINNFNQLSSLDEINDQSQISLLILVLQKAIHFSKPFPTLNDENNENLKHLLQQTRAIKTSTDISLDKVKTEITKLTQQDKDNIVDDSYALLLQSAYYPEYRRYIETLHRFIYLSEKYGIDVFYNILFTKDTSLALDEFDILKRFFKGRILLPQNIETAPKPLPEFEPESQQEVKPDENKPTRITDSVSSVRVYDSNDKSLFNIGKGGC